MLATIVALLLSPAVPVPQRGTTLFLDCKQRIRIIDSPTPDDGDMMEEFRQSEHCFAYIQGYLDASASRTGICLAGASFDTLIRVYIAYMEKHPTLLDAHMAYGLRTALMDAYPCHPAQN